MSLISSPATTVRINPQVVPTAPAWVATHLSTPNAWTQLPNTNIFDNVRLSVVLGGTGAGSDSTRVFKAWNGAALATGYGTYGSMIHWGGGHTDYYGNEVYAFDLETLTWAPALTQPSGPPWSKVSPDFFPNGLHPDGRPTATHNYTFVDYCPVDNSFYTFKRDNDNSGNNVTIGQHSAFDFSLLEWDSSTEAKTVSGGNGVCTQCYDSTRNVAWITNSSGDWQKFDLTTRLWSTSYLAAGSYGQSAISYCPSKDMIVFFVNNSTTLRGFDPNSPTTTMPILSTTGTGPSTWGNYHSCRWSSVMGAFYFYNNGTNVYKLTPPPGNWRTDQWTWEQLPVTSSPIAPTGEGGGVYGKWQIAEWGTTVVGILNNRHQGPCQAIRIN